MSLRLYIKQAVFSWVDRFTVYDEAGDDKYYVEGELFSWGKRLHVYDKYDEEVIYIQQQLLTLLRPKYEIFVKGQYIAELVREISLFKPYYTVDNLGWDIEGDFFAHEYAVTCSGVPVVSISKEWLT
jgi:Uncharacterized conserved protein